MDNEMYLRGLLFGSTLLNPKQLSVKCVGTGFLESNNRIQSFVDKVRKQGNTYSCLLKHRWEACLIEKNSDFMAGFLDSSCCSVVGGFLVIRVNCCKVNSFNQLTIPFVLVNKIEGRQRRWTKTHLLAYYYQIDTIGKTINSLRLSTFSVPQRLNEESAEKLLFGTLLGDTYFSKDFCLYLGHSSKQEEWLKYKANRLQISTEGISYRVHPDGSKSCRIRTSLSSDSLRSLRIELYTPLPNGKYRKTITKELLEKYLSKEALTWWYLDDGTIKNGRYCSLCLASFTLDEVKLVRQFLYKKWKIKTTIMRDRKFLGLYFVKETTQRFIRMISPFVPSCMVYKLGYLPNDIVPSQQKC